MEQLNQIFSKYLSENKNDYEKSFKDIADLLLNKHNLFIKDTEFELTEIEVYYKDVDNHDDISVHRDPLQQKSNRWYVHNNGRNEGRNGIDITFGDGANYGGILIRGIKEVGSGEYINGPVNVRKKIENILKTKSSELQVQLSTISSDPLRLEKKDNKGKTIYQGPRFGLTDTRNKYLVSPYRYIVDIKHKFDEKTYVYAYSLNLSSPDQVKRKNEIPDSPTTIEKFLKEIPANAKQKNRRKKILEYLKKLKLNPPQT